MSSQQTQCSGVLRYIVGFILCAVLTFAAYWVVEKHTMSAHNLYVTVAVLAIVQFVIQMFCFLRLNTRNTEARWDFYSFLFTILVAAVVIVGTMWIMYNLNYFMVH